MERKPLPPHHAAHQPHGHHGPHGHGVPDGADPRRWLVLAAMTGSLVIIFLDMTVVGVALPRIGGSLGMDAVGQNWIVTSYLLTLASLMALGGRIGDLVGKVPAFIAGVAVFAAASVVCASSASSAQMILGRVLQGAGACLMQPASGALVIGAFPPGERGKAMAAYITIPLLFMALGPVLGGVIVARFGWPWVFWLNVPIAAVAIGLTLVARPRDERSTDRAIDWIGGAMLLLGLPALVYGIQELGAPQLDGDGGIDVVTPGAIAFGAVVLAVFVRRQLRHPRPLLKLRLFADRTLAADAITISCMQFAMTGLVISGSVYAQDVLGYAPVEAGASLLPMLVPTIIVAQFAGRWYDRAGARAPASWGTALASVGMLVQAAGAWIISYPVMAAGMFVLGLGIAFTMSPTNTDALGRVPNHERGQLSGLVQTMRQVGGSIGVATVAATVAAALGASGLGDHPPPEEARRAMAHAYAVGYAVASLGTIAAFVAVRRWMAPGKPAVTSAPAPAAP